MKKKLLLVLLLFLPALLLLAGVNYFVDPVNLYHGDAKELVRLLCEGKEVNTGSGNMDERQIKKSLIESMPKEADCVVLGPSLALTVDRKLTGEERLYNLAMSSADLYDILAQLGIMEIEGVHPKRILFCVESSFFDEGIYGTMSRSAGLMPYANYMLERLDGKEGTVPKEGSFLRTDIPGLLCSVTLFQSSVDYLLEHGPEGVKELRFRVREDQEDGNAYLQVDGSLVYSKQYRLAGADDVIRSASEYNMDYFFHRDGHISAYSQEVFVKLVQYCQQNDIQLDLFMAPMSPALWERVKPQAESYPLLFEMETFAYEMARQYGLNLYGSFDPEQSGLTNDDFYDARHVKYEVLDRVLNLKIY